MPANGGGSIDSELSKLRLSSYLIVSERLKYGGYAMLSGLSGTVDIASDALYQAFHAIMESEPRNSCYIDANRLPPEITESFLRRGLLTELSPAEEREFASAISQVTHEYAAKQASVVIVPDLDCNYRCVYCFEKSLQSGLKGRKTYMDKTDVDSVFRCIDQIEAETGPIAQTISLFGGEPLLADNYEIVKYIVETGSARGYDFNTATNGHDLDSFIDILGSGGISSVQITIDGPQEIHDRRRVTLDGSSSFQHITDNIELVLENTDTSIVLRINIDADNYPHLTDLIHFFDQKGWLENDNIMVNVAFVDIKGPDGIVGPLLDINAVRPQLAAMIEQHPHIHLGSQQANLTNSAFTSLLYSQAFSPRSCYCPASSGSYVFLPDGTISCCWESLGEECGYIGSFTEAGLQLDQEKAARHFGRSVDKIEACLDCQYCLVCAGGCSQMAETNLGDLYQPHCGDFKETYAWVLADAVDKFIDAQRPQQACE